jgi:addiction module RelE/StbE family toxin
LTKGINWTDPALDDLSEIQQFITLDNPFAAYSLAVRIVEAAESLAEFPNRGRPGDEPETRELSIVRPYVIVYRVLESEVQILRVWHGAQSRT